jgi:hypothetical protein
MHETEFLNMAENLRTSLTLLSMYLASPSSLRLDREQWSRRLPGGIAKSSRILQKLFPSSLRPPPSTLMMAGHLEADDGRTAGMAWSDKMTTFLPPSHWLRFRFLGRRVCLTEQETQHHVAGVKLVVAIVKLAMFSTRTDLLTLPSPKEWKFSMSQKEEDIPPPPRTVGLFFRSRLIRMSVLRSE